MPRKFSVSLFIFILIFGNFKSKAQHVEFGKKIVDTLTSPYFWGRGYTRNGMGKAAQFLSNEFKTFGLLPQGGKSYLQFFTYPVNTFPGKMDLSINGARLTPGIDFIVSPESHGINGIGMLEKVDSANFINQDKRIMVVMEKKLTWSVAARAKDYTIIQLDRKLFPTTPTSIELNIENKEINHFKAANVCAFVKGTSRPDSFLVFTAHYDHLGSMGQDTYFPGANDNASGIALLLNLAQYFSQHPQPYSIAFICFAGEEAGLKGSKYYTENPLLPLHQIRFLVNTDLAGTGEEGITVVNATVYPKEFELLKQINSEFHLLKSINPRGKAANSDHYWFTEKGVPSVFFYTQGGISAYHDVNDKAETLPLTEHEDLFTLLIKFSEKLMSK